MRTLTEAQVSLLFVVQNNGPASVADVAGHLLMDEPATRNRLATLERNGLIARQYTGHNRDALFAYTITDAGSQAIADRDEPTEDLPPGTCWLCGGTEGHHLRVCANNPNRQPRRT